jgi:mono-ADP-ribosyltransferase sirtuin 6
MEKDTHGRQLIVLIGVDNDGIPVSYLMSVKLENSRRVIRAEPFSFTFRETLEVGAKLEFVLEFMGHYNEPNIVVGFRVPEDDGVETVLDMHYDPSTGEWMTMRS